MMIGDNGFDIIVLNAYNVGKTLADNKFVYTAEVLHMAVLNIRNLSDDVHSQLRIRAARAGRSMEAEARKIITEAVMVEKEALSATALQSWVDNLYAGNKPQHVVNDLIQERRFEAEKE